MHFVMKASYNKYCTCGYKWKTNKLLQFRLQACVSGEGNEVVFLEMQSQLDPLHMVCQLSGVFFIIIIIINIIHTTCWTVLTF